MNDLIKEFSEQSGLLGPSSRIGNSHDAAERFAELIVRECVEVLSDKRFDNVRPTMNIAQAMINQHFGVEE